MAAAYGEQSGRFTSQAFSSFESSVSSRMPSKINTPNLATLSKASELLNSFFEKDAQMIPDLKDLLPGTSSSTYNVTPHRSWAPFFRPDGLEGFKAMPMGVFDEYDEG
ncbi:hypothetical protein Clacol_003668 [Clathrus columnatus]|uniref:Uncharacterized protein n=1 Tax=Clathrus columnatus TaxID=1419009 RepID=A0AAV5ABY8_9AGAM|nr:hypothetical protein Clacol_003668 [Clathrus columnatus]